MIKPTSFKAIAGLSLLSAMAVGCKDEGGGGGPVSSQIGFDETRSEMVVILNRDLGGGEKVHARVRSLAEGDSLDCGTMASAIPTFSSQSDAADGGRVFGGEAITEDQFEVPTTSNTLRGESDEELQARLAATYYVDVCVEKDGEVLHQARYSLNQALDRVGADGKFDANDDGVRIESNTAYAAACEEELGPNPLFAQVTDENGEPIPGDYLTADCLDGVVIPTEVDGVPADEAVSECDKPQYIYADNDCEADAREANGPRVQSARNDQGTSWVLLCRKSLDPEGSYHDIAMIGHNPFSGKTCFFQNKLDGSNGNLTDSTEGTEVPWPGDSVSSTESPKEGSELWSPRIEGGANSGIGCAGCHDADAFIHSPWIDQAKREDGTPVVPKIGVHDDYVEGYNRPYSLLDQDDQGWKIPRRLVSEEASACTSCHSMNNGQWINDNGHRADDNGEGCNFCDNEPWLNRLDGSDAAWTARVTEAHQDFDNVYWMPPTAGETLTEETWEDSEYAAAMAFMLECGANSEDPQCEWEEAPTEPGNPNDLPTIETTGEDLARAALAVVGARYINENGETVDQNARCSGCHPMSPFNMGEWRDRTQDAVSAGIDLSQDPDELSESEAMDLINYMRKDSDNPESVFAPYKIGVFSAIAQYPYFRKLFEKAFGNTASLEYSQFLARVSMPKGSAAPLTAEEGAILIKWFVDENANHLDSVLPEAPRPATCADVTAYAGLPSNGIPADDSWFEGHLDDMEFEGHHAKNVENGINMYGCSGTDGTDCFNDLTDNGFGGNDVAGNRVVKFADFDFNTSYWMRSSADGRFVGNGGSGGENFGATVTDLIADRNIGVRGSYDPGFFPNNNGFIMQGSGAGLCGQSVLTNETAIEGGIDFTEEGCSNAENVALYQHVAVNLDGGDYFIINAQFTSDPGGASQAPRAGFGEGSTMRVHPLVFNGADWDQKPTVEFNSPYEGDSVLSPSGRLVISRFAGPEGSALGYMVRRLEATPSGDSYDININQPVRFICDNEGAKANISFDERFSVTHSYGTGTNDTSNLFLTDMRTNETVQITDMPAGVQALFPHFRSDGWIYFLVSGDGPDQGMAVNAAVVLANQ